ncbi:MAG: BatA domain-containing protein [Verrucomicrobia bacterium]|nr:BatA domain-containing protein [Verrucomicrobiota bacterium]
MSFLAPLFLLGALAVAAPIVFHLVRRTTRERVRFSSLMFLRPEPPRLTQRNRIEHWLLLALRCAVLGLLAAGFARPFLRQDLPAITAPGQARQMVLLLDTSASMRRDGVWNEALARAEAVLRRLGPADAAAVFTFDRTLTSQISREEWVATPVGDRLGLALARLREIQPGWQPTHLDQALTQAADLLNETAAASTDAKRQIVVISDFQAGSQLGSLQQFDWPKGVEVSVESVRASTAGNAFAQLLADVPGSSATRESAVRVRVSNEPDSTRDQFQIGWAGPDGAPRGAALDVYVPPGQSRVVSLPAPPPGATADRVLLRGDEQAFDNTVFALPPEPVRLEVVYAGSDVESDRRGPLFFLRRAFQDTPLVSVRVVSVDRASGPAPHLVVVTGPMDDSVLPLLRNALAQGRVVLFAPVSASAFATLGKLVAGAALGAVEERPAHYALLGELDFRHPLFAPFADPRFSDFTKIHFWQYRRLDLTALAEARVLARFDSGDPAIAELPVGPGRLLMFAAGWHPEDSQLALSSKFVPLLYAALELGGGRPPDSPPAWVGASIRLPVEGLPAGTPLTLQPPNGVRISLPAGTVSFDGASAPGLYELAAGAERRRFAVNLDPAESRTSPLPADEFERLGVPGGQPSVEPVREAQRQARLQNAELESRQKLWRWLLAAAVGILLLETWLAGWTARRQTLNPEAAT